MKTIQIIKGTFGYLREGAVSVVLKDNRSGPFEVSDAVAYRLVRSGIAEIAEDEDFVAAYDETMTKKQLVDVGKGLGVELSDKMSKADMLEALDAAAAGNDEKPEDDSEDTEDLESDGEAPPAINPAEPE